jgi:hypothetical protein
MSRYNTRIRGPRTPYRRCFWAHVWLLLVVAWWRVAPTVYTNWAVNQSGPTCKGHCGECQLGQLGEEGRHVQPSAVLG